MTTSNRLGITELASTQADRAAKVNEAIARLEGGATLFAAKQVSLNTPPGSPAEGDLYVIGTSPTGAWASNPKQATVYYNSSWLFYPVFEGQFAYDQTADALYWYDGSAWSVFVSTGGGAPTTADYLVKTANGSLSAERVVTDTATISWDWSTSGQAKANLVVSYLPASYLDTDGTLAANSDVKIASQKAVKTYADALIAANDAMVFKGVTDCSANPNYPAANRGDTYRVSVAGKIGGASGTNVEAGDLFICLDDGTSSGTQAAQGSHWTIAQANLDGAVIGPASATDGHVALFDGATGKLIKDGGTFASFTAASTTEQLTGTDTSKGSTPDSVAALWEKGADAASSGTVAFGEGGFFHITGTTTITDLDFSTAKDGRTIDVVFDGILTLTHNGTTLKLPGAANITTAAGDRARVVQDSSDNVIVLFYERADGKPLVNPTNMLKSDTSANLTAGFTASSYNIGTVTSGTTTPDPANGNMQYMTNGGASTLAAPTASNEYTIIIELTNNGSAGTLTISGFDKQNGDALDTTNGSYFELAIRKLKNKKVLTVTKLV